MKKLYDKSFKTGMKLGELLKGENRKALLTVNLIVDVLSLVTFWITCLIALINNQKLFYALVLVITIFQISSYLINNIKNASVEIQDF